MSIIEPLFKESRHFISCYDDKKSKMYALQNLRQIASHFLSQGYGVIYGAEQFQEDNVHAQDLLAKKVIKAKEFSTNSNQQSTTKESVQALRKHLLLINPTSIRYGSNHSSEIVEQWLSEYSRAETMFTKDNFKPKRIIGISNPAPFYEKDEFDLFTGFEQRIERAFGDKLGLICWYKKKWLEQMTLSQLIKILNTHGSIIYPDLKTITFDSTKIIKIITETIDAIAIEDDKRNDKSIVSALLFGTIRHAYHLDEKSLVLEPDKLEHVLIRMIGQQSYKYLEKRIMTNLIKKIFEFSSSKTSTERRRKES